MRVKYQEQNIGDSFGSADARILNSVGRSFKELGRISLQHKAWEEMSSYSIKLAFSKPGCNLVWNKVWSGNPFGYNTASASSCRLYYNYGIKLCNKLQLQFQDHGAEIGSSKSLDFFGLE